MRLGNKIALLGFTLYEGNQSKAPRCLEIEDED